MGTNSVVFNQPVGQLLIKYFRIRMEITPGKEVVLQGTIKALVAGIVFGRMGSAPPVGQIEPFQGVIKISMKLRTVVGVNMLHFLLQEIIQAMEKVFGGR